MDFLDGIKTEVHNYFNLSKENAELKSLLSLQSNELLELKAYIKKFEKQLNILSVKKDSHNSSMSPLSDIVKKNQSLRKKSNKKLGGQNGHNGHTLELSKTPDEIIKLIPNYCNHCGLPLDNEKKKLKNKRQVVDIPPVLPIYTEYQNYKIKCSCGHCQESHYPQGVDNYIQYGPSIQSAIVYQHLLRGLVHLLETEKSSFAKQIKKLFLHAINLKKQKLKYSKNDPVVVEVESKPEALLKKGLSTEDYKKTETFRKSMVKHRNFIFTFLYYENVEPDNNASERAIRNIKVKQKISGQFKTDKGGDSFAVLRIVIDTAIKNKVKVKDILNLIAMTKHYTV